MKPTFHILSMVLLLIAPSMKAVKRLVRLNAVSDTVQSSRTGTASYYAAKFQGRRTCNGEFLDNDAYTCASSRYPYDTWVRVTHLRNGKSVLVRVTDRFRLGGSHLLGLTLRASWAKSIAITPCQSVKYIHGTTCILIFFTSLQLFGR